MNSKVNMEKKELKRKVCKKFVMDRYDEDRNSYIMVRDDKGVGVKIANIQDLVDFIDQLSPAQQTVGEGEEICGVCKLPILESHTKTICLSDSKKPHYHRECFENLKVSEQVEVGKGELDPYISELRLRIVSFVQEKEMVGCTEDYIVGATDMMNFVLDKLQSMIKERSK